MQTQLYTTKSGHIFVKGTISKDNKTLKGFFLIDTGSTRNILDKRIIEILSLKPISLNQNLHTLNNDRLKTEGIRLSFSIDTFSYEENFLVLEETKHVFGEGSHLLGILSSIFLFVHNLILDYENMLMYSSDEKIASKIDEFKHFSPFGFGIKNFGLPVLALNNCDEDRTVMSLLDTGSSDNIISERAVTEYKIRFEEKSLTKDIYDTKSSVTMASANIHFGLMMCSKDSNDYVFKQDEFEFAISKNKDFFIGNEKGQKIAAVIGSKYLTANKCIIDFNTCNLYSSLW